MTGSTNAGRITGLLAGYGVIMLIALMARVPAVERGVGADRLARWHAMGGRYIVCLVVTHALLITWGYAALAHTGVIGQAGTLLSSYPDVLMASIAGLLLVGVGVVSARAARRRMRYETWYFLHFYTYLAVALAFSHQFADGAEFAANRPGARGLVGAVPRRRVSRCSGTGSSCRCGRRCGTASASRASTARAPAWCRSSSPARTWTSCGPSPGSSSGGASSPATCGGPRTRTRCRRHRSRTGCASRSRTSASTARR